MEMSTISPSNLVSIHRTTKKRPPGSFTMIESPISLGAEVVGLIFALDGGGVTKLDAGNFFGVGVTCDDGTGGGFVGVDVTGGGFVGVGDKSFVSAGNEAPLL